MENEKMKITGNKLVELAAAKGLVTESSILSAICRRNYGRTIAGELVAETISGRQIVAALKPGRNVEFFDGYLNDNGPYYTVDGVEHPDFAEFSALVWDAIDWKESILLKYMDDSQNFARELLVDDAVKDTAFVFSAVKARYDSILGWVLSTAQELGPTLTAARARAQEYINSCNCNYFENADYEPELRYRFLGWPHRPRFRC